mgnify:FL=1
MAFGLQPSDVEWCAGCVGVGWTGKESSLWFSIFQRPQFFVLKLQLIKVKQLIRARVLHGS